MDSCYRVREGTTDDKPAVLKIHDNVYEGLDYLPEYYDFFQKNLHVTPYVYTENDKIIAFIACCRVDDGATIVTRAGRVCPDRHGKHLYSRFKSEIEALQKQDGVTRRHSLLKSIPPSESFLKSYRAVAAKEIHMFEYQRSYVSSKLPLLHDDRPKANVIANIPLEFLSPPYCDYLFPEERIILDWVPFRLLPANIPLFKGRNTVFFSDIVLVDRDTKCKTNEEIGHETEGDDVIKQVQGLLSASTVFKVQNDVDLSCNLDIFGSDIRTLREHIIFHLARIEAVGLEHINLRIFTTKGVFESTLLEQHILEPIGVKKLAGGVRKDMYVEQVVYEKDINK